MFFSKLSLKDQVTASFSESSANLIEIADKMKIMKDSFKQAIKKSGDTRITCFFALTFKYKLSACS